MPDEMAEEQSRNGGGRPAAGPPGGPGPEAVEAERRDDAEKELLGRLPRLTPLTITLLLAFVLSAVALIGVLNLPVLRDYFEGETALWLMRVGVVVIIVAIVVYFVLRERANLKEAERLLDRMSEANKRLRLLLDAGRDIAETLDLENTLEETLGYAFRASKADMGAVFMWDKGASSLKLAMASGVDAALIERPEAGAGQGALGAVAETMELQVLEEPRGPGRNVFEGAAEPGMELLVPLAAGGRFLGVIALGSKERRMPSDAELSLLDGLAELASLSVTNAELYRISRKSLEAAARQREVTGRVLDEMAAGVITTDARGRMLVFNREARRLTGYSPQEIAGITVRPGAKLEQNPLGSVSEGLLEVLEGGAGSREGEALILKKDRSLLPVSYRINRQTEGDVVLGATAVFMAEREMTSSKAPAEGLDYQVLLRSVGSRIERLYVHPLSRLIENVKGMDTQEWAHGREEVLRAIEGASGALIELLEDVEQYLSCTVSREWDSPSDNPLEPIVAEVVKRALRSPGAGRVMVSVSLAGLPPAFGHERMIRTALEKVIENAFIAALEGDGKVDISGRACEGSVRVDVRDGGPGVRSEDREMIYQPFFSTRDSHTGLGLSTARRVMERLGGRIGLEDDGAGAHFFLEFPTGNPEGTRGVGVGAGAEGGG